MYTPHQGLLEAIVFGMDCALVGLYCWSYCEFVDQEESRAEEAGMPSGWVCRDGSDAAEAWAEPVLGGNAAEENLCCR